MEQINNPTNTPVWLELESKEHQLYSQTKRFLEEEEFEKAKEHIIQLFELLGGDEDCKNKGFHELFYLRGEIKTKIPEPSHDDFLIAYQILNRKHVVHTKSVTIEAKKEDNNENVPKQQEQVDSETLPEAAVSTGSSTKSRDSLYFERLDQLKNSLHEQLQQQKESIQQQNQKIQEQQTHIQQLQQQNEVMLQAFNQQNQMFQQMQTDVIQLQQKMESLTNQTQPASNPTTASVTSETSNTSSSSSAPTQTEQARNSVTPEEAKPQPAVAPVEATEDATPKARSESTPVQNNNAETPKSRTATTITPSLSTSLIRPSYTMEGWLHKLGGWNKTKWESRYFSCDGIELVYHSSQQIIQTTSPKGNIYVKDIIAVEEVHFDVHRVSHCFAIQTPLKKYFFYADDEVSKKNWITALKKK